MADNLGYPPLPPPPGAARSPMEFGRPQILRPLGVGETIDAAIALYRRYWKQLIAIAAVIEVPYQVIQRWILHVEEQQVLIGGNLYVRRDPFQVTLLITLAGLLFVTPLLSGAMTRAVAGAYMGEPPDWRTSLRFAFGKLWILLAALLLSDLAIVGGLILLIVPGIIFAIRFTFVAQSVVVEDERFSHALGRSWRLSAGRFWPILGTLILAAFIGGFASFVLLIPSLLIGLHSSAGSATWVIQAILGSAASVIVAPFSSSVAVLMYFDCRIRKEGFDIAALAREIG